MGALEAVYHQITVIYRVATRVLLQQTIEKSTAMVLIEVTCSHYMGRQEPTTKE